MTYQCTKCGAIVPTVQPHAGFLNGYGRGQLKDGPCPAGEVMIGMNLQRDIMFQTEMMIDL